MSYDVLVKTITSGLSQIRFWDLADIVIMAVLLYQLLILTKETRAYQVLKGVGILFVAAVISDTLQLTTINWLLNAVLGSGIVLAVVLFQPEIRRALEHIGRGRILGGELFGRVEPERSEVAEELHTAVTHLAKRRVGALIVIERHTRLGDVISTGTRIDGIVSAPLIENIFEPNTPLHDGAVIIRNGEIVAAACFLPLSEDMTVSRELGTRHRAGLGISTVSDSTTIIVSEETGVISFAREGKLIRYVDEKALRDLLESIYVAQESDTLPIFKRKGNSDDK